MPDPRCQMETQKPTARSSDDSGSVVCYLPSAVIGAGGPDQGSIKMHSPGHSSADSTTMSSWPAGTIAIP